MHSTGTKQGSYYSGLRCRASALCSDVTLDIPKVDKPFVHVSTALLIYKGLGKYCVSYFQVLHCGSWSPIVSPFWVLADWEVWSDSLLTPHSVIIVQPCSHMPFKLCLISLSFPSGSSHSGKLTLWQICLRERWGHTTGLVQSQIHGCGKKCSQIIHLPTPSGN